MVYVCLSLNKIKNFNSKMRHQVLLNIKARFFQSFSAIFARQFKQQQAKPMNFRKLILLFSISSVLLYGLKYVKEGTLIHPYIWNMQLFFFCTFLIAMRINQIGLSRPAKQFHIFYFTSMIIRFFLALLFMFFVILHTKNQIVVFICDFMVMYLLYTWFEIYFLIHNLRADLKKSNASD